MKALKVKTDAAIKRALADQVVNEIQIDGQPLFLLPRKSRDSATWYLRFYKGGRKQESLGRYPDISLKDALKMKPIVMAKMLTEEKANKNKFLTVGEMLEWFKLGVLGAHSTTKHRKDSLRVAITKHLNPFFGRLKIHELTKDKIEDFFRDQESKKYKISSIKKRYSIFKQVLIKAKAIDLIESNILDCVKVSYFTTKKSVPRRSRLKLRHIPDMYAALEKCKHVPARVFNLFCLMHGTRLSETRKLKWTEVDFRNRQITFVAENVKNRVELVLPMTPQVYALLSEYQAWQKVRYQGKYVFPSRRGYISKATAEAYVNKTNRNREWTAHDYRKLIQPMLTKLRVNDSISEAIVNHKKTALQEAYNQEDMRDLILEALCRWHDYLDQFSINWTQKQHKTQKKKNDDEALMRVA